MNKPRPSLLQSMLLSPLLALPMYETQAPPLREPEPDETPQPAKSEPPTRKVRNRVGQRARQKQRRARKHRRGWR